MLDFPYFKTRFSTGTKAKSAKVANIGTNFSTISHFSIDTTEGADFSQEEYEERTAIMQFDGGLTKDEAEKAALIDIQHIRSMKGHQS